MSDLSAIHDALRTAGIDPELLADPEWRLSNLYKIIIKGDGDDDEGMVVQFRPNRAQRRFLSRLHHRNVILKARQLGFTTLIAIAWLDYALFNENVRCGIISHDRESAAVIFRDKVKFAYENLPEILRLAMPLKADNASELLFAHNNSSIRVGTSMRSGTIHRLHVSEYGKICAKFPDKAREVATGSLPAVPLTGIAVIESTAEGADGDFYKMTQRALAHEEAGKELTSRDYRLHFFPWWEEEGYRLPLAEARTVTISNRDADYFDTIEGEIGRVLTLGQRAWYVSTRDNDFQGNPERMWQEYPSTVKEAFQRSTEGSYYASELAAARKTGRIKQHLPVVESIPVDTFWDIGRRDHTAIWFVQKVGLEYRVIGFYEASGETLHHFMTYLQNTGYLWGRHYLPHDAAHKRLSDTNKSTEEMLNDLGLRNTEIVPRIDNELNGISMLRTLFPELWFDETKCADGLKRLAGFKKRWNKTLGAWMNEPADDDNCHGADALRQLAQAVTGGIYRAARSASASKKKKRKVSWRAA